MPKVLLATDKPFAASAVDGISSVLAAAGYELVKLEKYKAKKDLLDAIGTAEAVIVRSDVIDPEVLAAASQLKLVVRAGAGVDTIDLNAATAKNVCVMNTPGQNANAVAELAFGMMLTNARNHFDGTSGYELRGKSLGLYGCGNVSKFMIALAKGFDMDVYAYDPFLTPEQITANGAKPIPSVKELFTKNFVSLHCPATAETTKSINAQLMGAMPSPAVLINTARKEVVHEEDLKAILETRKDFVYLADVPPDSLKTIQEALGDQARRIFCTPKKMGAQTTEANNNAGIAAANQIVAFFEKDDRRFQVNKPGQKF
jgi:D-3-phosphoglycerate dehydrogenase